MCHPRTVQELIWCWACGNGPQWPGGTMSLSLQSGTEVYPYGQVGLPFLQRFLPRLCSHSSLYIGGMIITCQCHTCQTSFLATTSGSYCSSNDSKCEMFTHRIENTGEVIYRSWCTRDNSFEYPFTNYSHYKVWRFHE